MALLVAFGMALSACSSGTQDLHHRESAERILLSLNAEASTEPDEVLLAARAYTHLALIDATHRPQAESLLDRLMFLTYRRDPPAWGLSFPFDAFSDGTVNPTHTIYSYTTAAAGLAFMDAYEVFQDETYLERAAGAAQTLLVDTCCWSEGDYASVWYSDQSADKKDGLQVHNVSALTLALLLRLETAGIQMADGLADKLALHLMAEQGKWQVPVHASRANWPYRASGDRANDLIHETFIIEGLARYPGAESAVAAALDGVLAVHFDPSGHPASDVHTLGTRGWGPPAGLYILTGHPQYLAQTEQIAIALSASIDTDGSSTLVPDGNPRGLAWYALALARYAMFQSGERSLIPWQEP